MRRQLFMSLGLLLILCVFSSNALGQKVELLYTKAGLKQAMAYKKVIKTKKLNAFNALALRKASGTRAVAYLKKIATMDAVVIMGETALKAVAAIEFPMPVILVNATGPTAAKGAIIRVFESDFAASGDLKAAPVPVSDAGTFTVSADDLKDGKESILKCQGIQGSDLLNKLISEIAKLKS